MENATQAKEKYVMTYIGVHAFFLNEKGETLVIQRAASNHYRPLQWDIPGGKMLEQEDVEQAVIREIREETGLEVASVGAPLSVYVNREQLPHRKDVQIVFRCTIKNANAGICLCPREHCCYRWIQPSDLPTLNCMPYLAHFYEQVLEANK